MPDPLPSSDLALIDAHLATHGITRCQTGARSDDGHPALREIIRREANAGKAAARRPWQAAYDKAERRREKALPLLKAGLPHARIAAEMKIGLSTVHTYARQLRDAGRL